MDKLIKDLAIEPFKIGNVEINHLRIEISHDKGGHSWVLVNGDPVVFVPTLSLLRKKTTMAVQL